ncbi:MAG TPA: cache domain-containing protein, partial [Acidimicrobiales bacterium]|nr:cache domain-containing protein [Acidimicrobiales bacterium]
MRRARYRTRLVVGVLLASLPVTALTVSLLTARAAGELTKSTKSFLVARALHVSSDIDLEIEQRRQDVSLVAARATRIADAELEHLMSTIASQRGGYDVIELVDLAGKPLGAGDRSRAFTVPSSDWFRRASAGGNTVSPVYLDNGNVRWVFCSPVIAPDGRPTAVVVADVEIGSLNPQLAHADYADSAELLLVDGEHRLLLRQTNDRVQRVTRSDADVIAAGGLSTVINTEAARQATVGSGTVRFRDTAGRDSYAGTARIGDMGWGLVVKEDVGEALHSVNVQRRLGALLAGAGALVLVLFALVFARREAGFIRRLVHESGSTAEEVTASAAEMSSASEELAATTIQQTGTVTETSATMEELARSSAAIAQTVTQVAA